MSEIYQIISIETYNYPDDKGIKKEFLELWEKNDNIIRALANRRKEYIIQEGDDICKTIMKNNIYQYLFDGLDEYTKVDLEASLTNQRIGIFNPRIFKPITTGTSPTTILTLNGKNSYPLNESLPIDEKQLIKSLEQLVTLIDLLNQIFRTVFPCSENFNTYGFDIRNLIILSCTEFESQFIGILKANNIAPSGKFYTTSDYVKFKDVLKLSEYELRLRHYPDLPILSPFSIWDCENPTKSLEWYSNYNSIKHDRDNEFNKSRIIDLLNSISACYIILLAQYGESPIINEFIKNYWIIEKRPNWSIPEQYIKPLKDKEWILEKYLGVD